MIQIKDVLAFVDQNKDLYIRWLQELCRQPSIATQDRGMSEAAAMVEKLIADIGGKAEQIETAG